MASVEIQYKSIPQAGDDNGFCCGLITQTRESIYYDLCLVLARSTPLNYRHIRYLTGTIEYVSLRDAYQATALSVLGLNGSNGSNSDNGSSGRQQIRNVTDGRSCR